MTEDLRRELAEVKAQLARAEAELEDRKQFVAQVMDAEDRARRRIAQLIHDDALQNLLAANQDLIEAAPGRVGVTRAYEVVNSTIEHLREAMLALHPVMLEHGGLEQALGAVARQAERKGQMQVEVSLEPAAVGQNDELVLALARELLANASRHSDATRVALSLRRIEGAVELTVSDDGRGMSPARKREALAGGHIGLASVEQRIEANGGEFAFTSEPDGGTHARPVLLDSVA